MQKGLLYFSLGLNLFFILAFLYLIHALGGFSYLLYKMKNRGVGMVYEHRKSLFMELKNGKDAIVFLGNSLTQQCEWAELFGKETIVNRGITGDMTHGILSRLDQILATPPRKIFLMIGVNDLYFHPPKEVVLNYRKILQKIKTESPQTKLYIQSILPVNNDVRSTGIKNADIEEVNLQLKTLAEEFKLDYIDLFSLFANEQGKLKKNFTSDGIHINGSAYIVWKNKIDHLVND